MIYKIWANDKRFKTINFTTGLNIILAERTMESGQKDTRNGAGKTTLLNIIHFCLGADLIKLNLPKDELKSWEFFIKLEICNNIITAKRSIENSKIIVVDSVGSNIPIYPEKDSEGTLFYNNNDWKRLLGKCFFHIEDDYNAKYSPTFRSLVSYFTRRGIDAYSDPFKHFRNQKNYDLQMHNAFLLGLNWQYASEAQEIRDKENAIKALKSAIKVGIMSSKGELEAERIQIESDLKHEYNAIKSFRVHPNYWQLQDKSNKLTIELHELSNSVLLLKKKLTRYEESVSLEKIPNETTVDKLYSEAGICFPDNIKKTLHEAKVFHETIVKYRRLFLETEITQIRNKINSTNIKIKELSDKRAELFGLLKTHGALEEFSVLQERLVKKKERLETIQTKISNIREIEQHKKEIKTSKIELETKMQRDYEQSRDEWGKAVILFNENSRALYDEPGNLIINTTDAGYKFDVDIQKSSSEGVGKMKIFCYDLMLVELMTQKGGINFLFHDSSIFDGVDSRQRALALMYAEKKSKDNGFQYICAINSDMIPRDDLSTDFCVNDYVCLLLKDQSPEDSALGFHFEYKKT